MGCKRDDYVREQIAGIIARMQTSFAIGSRPLHVHEEESDYDFVVLDSEFDALFTSKHPFVQSGHLNKRDVRRYWNTLPPSSDARLYRYSCYIDIIVVGPEGYTELSETQRRLVEAANLRVFNFHDKHFRVKAFENILHKVRSTP